MIRKLMASTAVLALMTAGSFGIAQAQTQPDATQQAPAVTQEQQQDPAAATGAQSADQPTAEITQSDTSLTPEQPTLASAFMGKSVYSNENQEADNIGDVNDLIVSEDGSITHAVVGVGGFLGIGEKSVAVPFDELQVVERDGDIRLIYAATKEQLEEAQAFDAATYLPRGRVQQEQQQAADAAAGGQAVDPNAPMMDPNAPAATGLGAAADAGAAATGAGAAAVDAGAAAVTQNAADAAQPAQATDATAEQQAADASAAQQAEGSQSGTTQTEGFMAFNATDQIRASTLMGKEIYGAENNSIGEVDDLVLQPDGSARAAVVDVGGFLGVGEKSVAIPFDQIQMMQEGNEPRLTVAMTKEQLEQAPAYQSPDEMAAANNATGTTAPAATGDQTAATQPAAGTEQQATATQPAAGTDQQATGQQPADQTAANQPMADQGADQAQFTPVTQDLSADALMGKNVVSTQDENLGEIGDVVFNPKGDIQAVVIDVGGFLGIGEKPVAINFDQLNVQKNTNGDMRLQVNATQEQLQNAPAYTDQAQ